MSPYRANALQSHTDHPSIAPKLRRVFLRLVAWFTIVAPLEGLILGVGYAFRNDGGGMVYGMWTPTIYAHIATAAGFFGVGVMKTMEWGIRTLKETDRS